MKVAVRYYTKGGNTQKLAQAAAEALEVEAYDLSQPLTEKTDLLFLANSLYAFDAADAVVSFIVQNKDMIGKIVNMGTSASGKGTTVQLKKVCEEHHVQMSDRDFFCKGKFLLVHQGRPNKADLEAVKVFVKSVIDQEEK